MYSPDGTNVCGSRGGEFEETGSVKGVQGCKIVFLGLLPVHLFRYFCCRMYSLATMHSITDRQTDRQKNRQTEVQDYHANSRSLWSVKN